MGRFSTLNNGVRWALGQHGFLVHPTGAGAEYGFVIIDGVELAKSTQYQIHRSLDGVNTYYETNNPEEFAHSVFKYDKESSEITGVSNYKDSVGGNQFACKYVYNNETGNYDVEGQSVMSWWHSAHGDAPIGTHTELDLSEETKFHFQEVDIPLYVPYVEDIQSDAETYKALLKIRTEDGSYLLLPQIYSNGKLKYVHSDIEGYIAGVYNISFNRALAVFVKTYNAIHSGGGSLWNGYVARYDQATLLDVDLLNGTATSIGTLFNCITKPEAGSRLLHPFRFNQSGTKLTTIYKTLYFDYNNNALTISPITYPSTAGEEGESSWIIEYNITYNSETDSYSVTKDYSTQYHLRTVGTLTGTKTIVEEDYGIGKLIGYFTVATSVSLSGDLVIPYAANYKDNELVTADIVFTADTYNDSYVSTDINYTSSVIRDISFKSKYNATIDNPTLKINTVEYTIIEGDVSYYLYANGSATTTSDLESNAGITTSGTTRKPISFIDLTKDFIIFAKRSLDLTGDSKYNGYMYNDSGTQLVTYSYQAEIGVSEYMFINNDEIFNTTFDSLNAFTETTTIDTADYTDYNDYPYGWYLANYFGGGDFNLPDNYSNSIDYPVRVSDYITASIYSSVKIAIDPRSSNAEYIYRIQWPTSTISLIDPETLVVTSQEFDAKDLIDSSLTNFSTEVLNLPGTGQSFDHVSLL